MYIIMRFQFIRAALFCGTASVVAVVRSKGQYCQAGTLCTMKAVRVAKLGGVENLKLENINMPSPKENEVLIKVEAIGVNPVETLIRSGAFGMDIPVPYTPGSDVGGVVEEVGPGVSSFKKGDRVYTIETESGAYAQYLTANTKFVKPLTPKLSFAQGAALGVPYHTAYKALYIRANAKPTDTVLVHGASGAVGIAAVQIAKAKGHRVIGTAGTPEGLEQVLKAGADKAFNHREDNYMSKIKEWAGEHGIDVILEMKANVNLNSDLDALAFRGRVVVIGNQGSLEMNPGFTMGKETSILGMALKTASDDEWKVLLSGVEEGVKSGWVNPVIGKTYSLAEAGQAHQDIVNNQGTKGKLILDPKL